jgi:hypothetical protein
MNRRSFCSLLVAIPAIGLPRFARGEEMLPKAWARRNFEPDDPHNPVLGIHAMVHEYKDEESAQIAIGQLQTDGFLHRDGLTIEDFSPIETLPSPQAITLPSALRRYESAAPPSSGLEVIPYFDLAVQRDNLLVFLMVRGSDEPLLLETVTTLMLEMLDYDQSTVEPVVDETGRHRGGLWDLMLQEADAPAEFRMYQESDENGVANFST